ncbi:MAG TPA: DUF4255 domain-containing protein [Kofleriaceae bacterium]
MSNTYAIAAATATLHDVLLRVRTPIPGDPTPDTDLADTVVTSKPPDRARDGEGKNQLNIFLYQITPDAQLRNMPPYGTGNGETMRQPPVALRLYYLITAYGQKDEDSLAHRLLGRAMSILQDRAVFLPAEIQAALAGNDLYRQVERVRITPHNISTEELSKLWTTFQTNYRISVAYEVSVVLIDSAQTRRTPLPVLKRGPTDEGVVVLPSTLLPFPTLTDLILPTRQPGAMLQSGAKPGDVVTLVGNNLSGGAVSVKLLGRWSAVPFAVAPLAGATDTQIQIRLPDNQVDLPAGFYAISVGVTKPADAERVSNSLSFAIVPRILTITPPNPIKVDAQGNATITIKVSPQVWIDQPASMLLGDREVRANARTVRTDTLVFPVKPAPLGKHFVRVRVDGVDSFVIADYGATPLAFDTALQVNITP